MEALILVIGSIVTTNGVVDYANLTIERHQNYKKITNKKFKNDNKHVCQLKHLEYLDRLKEINNDKVANVNEYNEHAIKDINNNNVKIINNNFIIGHEKITEEKENDGKIQLQTIVQRSNLENDTDDYRDDYKDSIGMIISSALSNPFVPLWS